MRILSHTVIAAESGRTAKELLRGLWHISGSLLSRLKFRGAITVNGAPVTVNHLLHTGDILQADVSDQPGENPHILPVDYPLAILYEDEDLLLLDKPAGIAIHPAALTEETATVAGAVAHYLQSDSFHAVNRLGQRHHRHHGRSQDRLCPRPLHDPAPYQRLPAGLPRRVRRPAAPAGG